MSNIIACDLQFGKWIAALALRQLRGRLRALISYRWYIGKFPGSAPPGSIIVFPSHAALLGCGLAGLVAIKSRRAAGEIRLETLTDAVSQIVAWRKHGEPLEDRSVENGYLGSDELLDSLWESVSGLKREASFCALLAQDALTEKIRACSRQLTEFLAEASDKLAAAMGVLSTDAADVAARRLERLKDVAWALEAEILVNLGKVVALMAPTGQRPSPDGGAELFHRLNAVLNSIDRLEVRGRDSAGISLMFVLAEDDYRRLAEDLTQAGLTDEFEQRRCQQPLVNRSIGLRTWRRRPDEELATVTLTYKVAVEIGKLGDNISFLRRQIATDDILRRLARFPAKDQTVLAHTRWASVGAITQANCHPVDNQINGRPVDGAGIIHTCLNGDIDNYLELKAALSDGGAEIHPDVTTDTKIIPLQIEHYLRQGHPVAESFRLAVNDFEGSHAIAMHTDLAPGRLFLAQRGSGQAIFVGLAEDHYMPASEVYGFIEETDRYLKLDGETVADGFGGQTQGQIFILDQASGGGPEGITAMHYDGTPLRLGPADVKTTALTSRDIDRQGFDHYFLKEISEAPRSVERTLQNRWKIRKAEGRSRLEIELDEFTVPVRLREALADGAIKRVYFIGQGTAGVAALACANILSHYLNTPSLPVSALKASEFSGFALGDGDRHDALSDALVIAISQSGTTTDTNRTVDMARKRGAHTLAIVNRRDSDITFKVDGVMYTSSGRDIEMSVASTKAFYSQIIAGALLGLFIAKLQQRRDDDFIDAELQRLLSMPGHMRAVLDTRERIQASATRLATSKTFWAAVGSGPNKASADEIRIKLSELCYKTISSDYVEDKKHIDLSSEPLIIVCAAGTRPAVVNDIIKDTAIFKAHKATPVVIANQGERRFDHYAADVLHVPAVDEHLAPILNTLVGHVWGYYAALAINTGSQFLFRLRHDLQETLQEQVDMGLDMYEIILEQSFREKIARYYFEFRQLAAERRFPTTVGFDGSADIILLLKYLAGRLPVGDFELDFGNKGTPANMLNRLFASLTESIGYLARPVDAIKHQAKTVTVGTSRVSERMEGLLFETLSAENINLAQLTNRNIIVLKNLQAVVAAIEGSILYRIDGLNLLGEPGENAIITVKNKKGSAAAVPSRVETDNQLKGSKRTIVRDGNVYIGKGRKDDRSILVIPILSAAHDKPNIIEYMLLLHIGFAENVPLAARIKALGGKYENIKNIVQENSVSWSDSYLERVAVDELFGRSAEKIAEHVVAEIAARRRDGFMTTAPPTGRPG